MTDGRGRAGSKIAADAALIARLLRQAGAYRRHIGGVLALSLLALPLALLLPLPIKIAIDSVLGSHPVPGFLDALLPGWATQDETAVLLLCAGLLVLVAFLHQCQQIAYEVLRTYTGERVVLAFRSRLFDHVQRLSFAYHDTRGPSDTIYRIQYDAPAVQYVAVDALIALITAALTMIAMLYVSARIDWVLALIVVGSCPLLLLFARAYRTRLRGSWHTAKELESTAMSVVHEAIGAMRVVRAFGQEAREHDRFVRHSRQSVRAKVQLAALQGGYGLVIGMTIALTSALLLYVGIRHVQSGTLTLGELLLVIAYLAQVFEPLRQASQQAASLQASLASADRVFNVIDELPDVTEGTHARPLARARGALAFRAVDFAYQEGHPVLQGVSLGVEPGARLGVVGATGAGKTTLIGLLMRFYDPTRGTVLLDGVDLREYRLMDLRRQFAIVLQEPVLLSATIAENIAYARPSASDEEIVAAARAAGADGFITHLKDGYATRVGERGLLLSGGERQRVSLARAFLMDAPILVMDEPTSSVDVDTEASILEAAGRLMAGRTSIIISHRASTLSGCDALIRLHDGAIAAASGDSLRSPSNRESGYVVTRRTGANPRRSPVRRPDGTTIDPSAEDRR